LQWWQHAEKQKALYAAIQSMSTLLVVSQVGNHAAFAFQRPDRIFSNALIAILIEGHAGFAVLQSRVHELWARFFGSSMKDDLRYAPSDCFQTFPFPDGWGSSDALEDAGRAYYDFRAALMVRNDEGLTKTYNRFHDRDDSNPEMLRLRVLHDAMDRAVLDAYRWTDIRPTCDFFLDYEEEEAEDDNGKPSKKRKPWRYRWPDEVRDEVLARLLALNRSRTVLADGQRATEGGR
jgi:hypothetical protein